MESQRHRNHTHSSGPKSLKLVGKQPLKPLRLGAIPASDDLNFTPGQHLVKCNSAWTEPYKGVWRIVWQFEIVDGPHRGVGFRKWKTIDRSCEVSRRSEYARACETALERPLEESDDLNDPGSIFTGKKFVVFIGYRKTERPGGGGRSSDELALQKKDESDKLKVHDIRSLVKL